LIATPGLRCTSLLTLLVLIPMLGCLDPADRRPGLWLSGELVEDRTGEWTFTDDYREIMIEIQTAYWVPYSLTIFCVSIGDRLYVAARHPATKNWVRNVDRNPDVRLKIGVQLYEQRLVPVEANETHEAVYAAYAAKYEWPPISLEDRPEYRFFEVVDRGAG
jgi:hypothetical protein